MGHAQEPVTWTDLETLSYKYISTSTTKLSYIVANLNILKFCPKNSGEDKSNPELLKLDVSVLSYSTSAVVPRNSTAALQTPAHLTQIYMSLNCVEAQHSFRRAAASMITNLITSRVSLQHQKQSPGAEQLMPADLWWLYRQWWIQRYYYIPEENFGTKAV